MARKLAFKDDLWFTLTYEGFLGTARGTTRQEHRTIDRIIDRLESISVANEEMVPGFNAKDPMCPRRRNLDTSKDGIIILEDTEYEYFKQTIEQVQCTPPWSRVLTRLQDFIAEAPAGDAKVLATG